jgi:hypothetical protein
MHVGLSRNKFTTYLHSTLGQKGIADTDSPTESISTSEYLKFGHSDRLEAPLLHIIFTTVNCLDTALK